MLHNRTPADDRQINNTTLVSTTHTSSVTVSGPFTSTQTHTALIECLSTAGWPDRLTDSLQNNQCQVMLRDG